jgi:glycopeptide antibiotics resistance protein
MKSKIMKIIFWIYNIIMLLFYFRILPKPVNLTMSRELVRDMRAGGWQVYNLVPFSSYSSFVIDPTGSIMRIIWHIAMFAILAFLLSAAFEDMPLKKRCALLFVYALMPEVVQFVLSIGLFDIDSVIQNIFGAALGLLAAWAFVRLFGRRKARV